MAEGRNPIKRTLEILGGTAKEIGKDYTSNFQSLITDAATIKSTVIQGAHDAKDTFERMKNGTGPIKGVLNWFYSKEGETDQWDLDSADSDFDAGTNFETDEDGENVGPGVLNVSDARDLTRGHINSMFKIAAKISEAQVANTAEIISTMNSRTSEMVASINNVNTTLIGISKQIDSIAKVVVATQEQKKRNYDSLLDSDGRLTLGGIFDAAKNNVQNSNAVMLGGTLKTIFGSGMFRPEDAARWIFDLAIGDKKLKGLGDQSINQLGNKLNDAIGQGISDGLEKLIGNGLFKRIFGDLKEDMRSNNFGAYIRNEYTKDAAMFDGMTRKSIVEIIPGYLRMIHEDLSGQKTNIDHKGNIVKGSGNTWANAVSRSLFSEGAGNDEFLEGLLNDKSGRHHGLDKRNLNSINIAVTGALVQYMTDNRIRMLDKHIISSRNRNLCAIAAAYLDGANGDDAETWLGRVVSFLQYTESDFGRLNNFVRGVNQQYEKDHRALEEAVQMVNDKQNVGYLTNQAMLDASRIWVENRNIKPKPPNPIDVSGLTNGTPYGFANGDIPPLGPGVHGGLLGNGPEMGTTTLDMMEDIRTLLAANVKKNIGAKKFSTIKLSSPTKSQLPDFMPMADIGEDVDRDKTPDKIGMADIKEGFKELGRDLRGTVKESAANFRNQIGDNQLGYWIDEKGQVVSNKVNDIRNSQGWQNVKQGAAEKAGKIKDFASEGIEAAKDKFSQATSAISSKAYEKSVAGFNKAVDMVNKLGHSSDDEEDRNTMQLITTAMQTAIQNGSASQQEKTTIQRLIDTIHNRQLKSKLKRHANAILENSSFEMKGDNASKKGVFGKILGFLGLIVSPIRLLGRLVTWVTPKLMQGGKSLLTKVFGNDFKQLKYLGGQLKEEFGNLRDLRKQYKQEKSEARAARGDEPGNRMTLSQALSPITQPIGNKLKSAGAWLGDKAATVGGYGLYYGGQLLDKGKELGGKIADKALEGAGYALYQGQRIAGGIKDFGSGALEVGKNLASGARDALATSALGRKIGSLKENAGESAIGNALNQTKENLKQYGQDKFGQIKENLGELKTGFKLGTMTDFKQGFEEAAGIKKPGSIKIDGVEGSPETYSDQVMAQTYGVLTGQKESLLTQIVEYLDPNSKSRKEAEDEKAQNDEDEQNANQGHDQGTDDQNQENQQGETGQSQPTGSIKGLTDAASKSQSESSSSSSEQGGSWGANDGTGAESTGFTEDGGENGGEGADSLTGGGSTEGSGAEGALKGASTLMKIGASLGKITKILGSIGKVVLKIVGKAIMMLSGFKALRKTLGSVIPMITKVISMGLKPLNKIFNFLNKTLKPIIAAIKKVLSTVMQAVSGILSAVFDTLVPILNNIVTPVLNALMPVIDVVLNVLQPLFDVITSVIDVVLVPIGGLFKYVLLPIIKQIGDIMKVVMGILELGFGALMVPLGGILTAVGAIAKLFGGGSGLADSGKNMMKTGAQMVVQGLKDIGEGIMNFVSDVVKTITLQDQSVPEEETKIENPNAREITSVGSVMDGYASGDIYNISNIYGNGRAQGSYGGALSMKDNGCGPVALADAYNRRHGTSVDGLNMAKSMASAGTYEPGKGTSVSSFMKSSAALGTGLTAGGVTQSSLKRATPHNPVTLVGSGSGFDTKSGNTHYVNVVGTDKYGGAYVSNPLTGRVDRKSASSLASNSVLGLYGSGDTGTDWTMPDVVADALSNLKSIAGSLFGMFTKSASDAMSDQMTSYEREQKLSSIKDQLNAWFKRMKTDKENGEDVEFPEDYDEEKYGDDYYQYVQDKAEEEAYAAFSEQYPREDGETEEEHKARFKKWYTDERKLKYIAQQQAYKSLEDEIKSSGTKREGTFVDFNEKLKSAQDEVGSAADAMQSREGNGTVSGGSGFYSPSGKSKMYMPFSPSNKDTNMQDFSDAGSAKSSHSPIHEFFKNTWDGIKEAWTFNSGYYQLRSTPTKEGVGTVDSGGHHAGADVNGTPDEKGQKLFAITDGTVTLSRGGAKEGDRSANGGGGNYISIKDNDGYIHTYMHMKSDPTKSKDAEVKGGDLLGYVGNTGDSDGAHLHYQIVDPYGKEVNPFTYWVWKEGSTVQGKINVTDPMKQYSLFNNYKDQLAASKYHEEAQKAGLTPGQEASIAGMAMVEDSGQKIFGTKSLTRVVADADPSHPYAFGLMNWAPSAQNARVGAEETMYGTTLSEQLPYILKAYYGLNGAAPTHNRAQIQQYNYDTAKEAIQTVIGHDLAQKPGDFWGEHVDEDLAETQGHYVANAVVPVSYPTVAGQGKYIGTAVDVYNWMIDSGLVSVEEANTEATPAATEFKYGPNGNLDANGYSRDDYETVWKGNTSYLQLKSGAVKKNTGAIKPITINDGTTAQIAMSEQFSAMIKNDNDDPANIRSSGSLSAPVIGQIPAGTAITVTRGDTSGNWFKVSYNGITGYVAATALNLTALKTSSNSSNNNIKITGTIQTNSSDVAVSTKKDVLGKNDPEWGASWYEDPNNYSLLTYYNNGRLKPLSDGRYYTLAHMSNMTSTNKNKKSGTYYDNLKKIYGADNASRILNNLYDNYGSADEWMERRSKWITSKSSAEGKKFPEGLDYLHKAFYGSGDASINVDTSDLGGFASIMNAFTSTDGDIPEINADKINEALGGTTATSTSVSSNYTGKKTSAQDERLRAILENKFSVSDERVAQLLEMILSKMGDRDKPTNGGSTTPKMFSTDQIPQAVQRLSKG